MEDRATAGTQLVNDGAKITTVQALLGHERLNTTMVYARVHDKTVIEDYFRALEKIEGEQTAVLEPRPKPETIPETAFALLDKLGQEELSGEQRQILDELRRCLTPE